MQRSDLTLGAYLPAAPVRRVLGSDPLPRSAFASCSDPPVSLPGTLTRICSPSSLSAIGSDPLSGSAIGVLVTNTLYTRRSIL